MATSLPAFYIVALVFVILLTTVVRLAKLRVRGDCSSRTSLAFTLGFVGLVLLVWWFVTSGAKPEDRWVNINILPSPAEMLGAFKPLHLEQALVRNAMTSLGRTVMGFALAVIVAVPLGTYMGTFPPIAAFFKPVSLVGSYVPTIVFVPLTIAWFGATEPQKIAFIFIVYFVALLPLIIKTVADVPAAYLDVASTKGATQWQLVRHVLFPVAQADIWDHLRGAYGVGWTWIILAEVWANAERGLGYLLDISYRRSRMDRYFAVVVVIVVIAIGCDQLWRFVGRRLFPYKYRE
jgi:NitT/TauT family transport system permease protein